MKKQIGIWLDFSEAFIVRLQGEEARTSTLPSEIEHGHVKGGARSSTPWGPVDVVDEKKLLARSLQQERAYFERIMETVGDGEELYIFGPAEAKLGLENLIRNSTTFRPKLMAVETADSMTPNQKVARVKTFFLGDSWRKALS